MLSSDSEFGVDVCLLWRLMREFIQVTGNPFTLSDVIHCLLLGSPLTLLYSQALPSMGKGVTLASSSLAKKE